VTSAFFTQRIPQLLIDARDLPRRPLDFHIVLISAMSGLHPSHEYTEKQINSELEGWVLEIGNRLSLDHAALRRYLVDAGFLIRDSAGSLYKPSTSGREVSFDPEILAIDLERLISAARQDKLERKQRYQARIQDA
jgi:hypothetical protein